jgi:hypothetical protein
MQETKYGVHPREEISRDNMKHVFKRMCIVYETIVSMVHFLIYTIMYILLYINVDMLITLYFYVCRWNIKNKSIKKTLG